ncbi:M56 family metallopeptidase [Pedobacter boryungensis]|uniref:M56 family metallopeptidase n=1 Tax=Pedobacter boryungensis TaxID=869962 RepID=A0ABX2DDS3_9SPHI|nr:M56 family metallopeptidase [Pedobacter boryungensis]NQX31121.1 M56 family metallopeptidase [Pedobacter boryungensis]
MRTLINRLAMPALLLILLKINLVLLLFAAAYYLVLRRLTFYTINRIFLVLGIIFSTIYPFINLTDFFHRQEQVNPNVAALVPKVDMNALIQNNVILDYWKIILILFYVGVVFMALRLIAQFISLYRVHQKSKPGSVKDLSVRILDEQVSPFSFWQTVYVNPEIHSTDELDTILAHEQIHVKEWHTLDIILAEISVVFYWFNPGVWLMKKAIKENIEFITDARIVKKGIDKKSYQYSLLGVGSLQPSVALVNNFNLSDLKKRIKMMNAKRSSPKKLVIYALILPALLITSLAFTISKKEVKQHLMPLERVLINANLMEKSAPDLTLTTQKVVSKKKINERKPISITIDTAHKLQNFIFIKTISINTDSTNLGLQQGDEKIVEGFALKSDNPSSIEDIKIKLKGTAIGPNVAVNDVNITPINATNVTVMGFSIPKTSEAQKTFFRSRNGQKVDTVKSTIKFLYVLDGKKVDEKEFNKINPDQIKNITVKKQEDKMAEITVVGKSSRIK